MIKIKLLPNKRYMFENRNKNKIIVAENNASFICVSFPEKYLNYSKRVDFLTARKKSYSLALYCPTMQEYSEDTEKLVFKFSLPSEVTEIGELNMQFVAYLPDDSLTCVPFEMIPLQIDDGITRFKKLGVGNADLIALCDIQSKDALLKSARALSLAETAKENADKSVLDAEKALTTADIAKEVADNASEKAVEAKNLANSTKEIAENALTVALESNLKAESAETTANRALNNSQNAINQITMAVDVANTAEQKANIASETATNAINLANIVKNDLDNTKIISQTALEKVMLTEDKVNWVIGDIQTALDKAIESKDLSNQANESASLALEKAENAEQKADSAVNQLDTTVESVSLAVANSQLALQNSSLAIQNADSSLEKCELIENSVQTLQDESVTILELATENKIDLDNLSDIVADNSLALQSIENDNTEISTRLLNLKQDVDDVVADLQETTTKANSALGKSTANETKLNILETAVIGIENDLADLPQELQDVKTIAENSASASSLTTTKVEELSDTVNDMQESVEEITLQVEKSNTIAENARTQSQYTKLIADSALDKADTAIEDSSTALQTGNTALEKSNQTQEDLVILDSKVETLEEVTATLDEKIDSTKTQLTESISQEANVRELADNNLEECIITLEDNLQAESTTRESADNEINERLNSHDAQISNTIKTEDFINLLKTNLSQGENIIISQLPNGKLEIKTILPEITVDKALNENSSNPITNSIVTSSLNLKVDKQEGKDLSDNNFTDWEKSCIHGIYGTVDEPYIHNITYTASGENDDLKITEMVQSWLTNTVWALKLRLKIVGEFGLSSTPVYPATTPSATELNCYLNLANTINKRYVDIDWTDAIIPTINYTAIYTTFIKTNAFFTHTGLNLKFKSTYANVYGLYGNDTKLTKCNFEILSGTGSNHSCVNGSGIIYNNCTAKITQSEGVSVNRYAFASSNSIHNDTIVNINMDTGSCYGIYNAKEINNAKVEMIGQDILNGQGYGIYSGGIVKDSLVKIRNFRTITGLTSTTSDNCTVDLASETANNFSAEAHLSSTITALGSGVHNNANATIYANITQNNPSYSVSGAIKGAGSGTTIDNSIIKITSSFSSVSTTAVGNISVIGTENVKNIISTDIIIDGYLNSKINTPITSYGVYNGTAVDSSDIKIKWDGSIENIESTYVRNISIQGATGTAKVINSSFNVVSQLISTTITSADMTKLVYGLYMASNTETEFTNNKVIATAKNGGSVTGTAIYYKPNSNYATVICRIKDNLLPSGTTTVGINIDTAYANPFINVNNNQVSVDIPSPLKLPASPGVNMDFSGNKTNQYITP